MFVQTLSSGGLMELFEGEGDGEQVLGFVGLADGEDRSKVVFDLPPRIRLRPANLRAGDLCKREHSAKPSRPAA